MNEHTPGPWECVMAHWGRWQIYTTADSQGHSFNIGDLSHYVGLGGQENELNRQQDANARLIAAAPDLLTVARMALAIAQLELGEAAAPAFSPDELCDLASAAITKATGAKP